MAARRFQVTRIDELERIPLEANQWRPIRRTLGVTGFGINAYTAAAAGDEVAAPQGTLLVVPPGTRRGATATQDGTTVLVIGGVPGAAGPRTAFEYWYEAEPHYRSGDYARAVEVASKGLEDWPEHPSLRYQLACYEALQGHRDAAIEHLEIAFERNPDTRTWAADDEDLASVRDDPALA